MIEQYVDDIKRMYDEHIPSKEIAEKFGLKVSSLNRYFFDHRDLFPKRNAHKRVSKKLSRQIYIDYIEHQQTVADISAKYGICEETVRRHIRKQHFKH